MINLKYKKENEFNMFKIHVIKRQISIIKFIWYIK